MTLVLLLLFPVQVHNSVARAHAQPQNDPFVYVLVNSTVYGSLSSTLLTYKHDLESDGFSVEIFLDFGNSAETIREFLQSEAETHEIAGVLLVGDVPYATYITKVGDWNYTYPCDLYYMDLDGTWIDSDSDGTYDEHSSGDGDLEPEIWTGRLYASTMTGDEEDLLVSYFDKNHRFRVGELTLPRRALAYVDEGFLYHIDSVNSTLRLIYGTEITLVTDPETTNATHYKKVLNDTLGYEWLHLESHGNFKKHSFNTSEGWTDIFSSEIRSVNPHAFFYNLMACGTADYSRQDFIGGSYIFADTYGLLAVSSTKPGAMSNFFDFYGPISEGKCIGQAFKSWFEKNGELSELYYYGLTILGDPTLRTPRICDVAITNVTTPMSVVVQNSTLPVNITVENKGESNFTESFDVTLYTNTTIIGNMTVTDLQPLSTRILTFNWNTTGVTKGNYRINATAVLPIDNNPNDNTYADRWVAVILKNDIAVSTVTPSKSRVVQNSTLLVNVTVENKGNSTETFNVTIYANTTLIGSQTNVTLATRNSTTLIFIWNTTSFARGNHMISAAAVLPVDNDPSDNICTYGWVVVTFENDIAVISLTAGDSLYGEIAVYSGCDVDVNVTVRNRGVSVETFNVSVYADANTTVIGDEITIVNYTVTNLGSGASNVTAVTWVTSGVPTCRNYTISAYAHPVPGETDTNNNLRVDASIYVRKRGDVNGDNSVDGGDQIKVGNALWSNPGDPTYNPYADVNYDGSIDGGDQITVGNYLWENCP